MTTPRPCSATYLQNLWDRHKGRCFYCACKTFTLHRPLDRKVRVRATVLFTQPGRQASREHLIRRCDGGGMGSNIVLACRFCNEARHSRSVAEHKAWVLQLIAAGRHPNVKSLAAYQERARKYAPYILILEAA